MCGYRPRTPPAVFVTLDWTRRWTLDTNLFGLGLGIVAGKLMADLTFYLPVIYTYERRKRRAVKDR